MTETHNHSSTNEKGLAIVTGGSKGIGRAAALELAKSGFDVAVLDIVEEKESLESISVLQTIRPASLFIKCDLNKVEDHKHALKVLSERFRNISCLVNNAGVQMVPRRDILEISTDEYDRVIDINLRGTFFLTQTFAPAICRSNTPNRTIINVTSVNATMVSVEKSAYCISKAALSMSNQLYAIRLAEHGVGVYEVRPGYTRTEMTTPIRATVTKLIEAGLVPAKRWGEPEDVAKTIAALADGSLRFTTGDIIHVAGGMQIPRIK